MSAIDNQITIQLAGSEILDTTEAPQGSTPQARTMRTAIGMERVALNAASVPKVDKPIAAFNITGVSGSPTTIDLTAVQGLSMPLGSTRTLDLTGAKIKAFCLRTDPANVGTVKVEQGASNPYLLWGSGDAVTLHKGRIQASSFLSGTESALAAVAAGAKTLKFTFSNTGDKIYVELWAGT
jgi:hypothetical protein